MRVLSLLVFCACACLLLTGTADAHGRGAALAVECAPPPAKVVLKARVYYPPPQPVIIQQQRSYYSLPVESCGAQASYGCAPAPAFQLQQQVHYYQQPVNVYAARAFGYDQAAFFAQQYAIQRAQANFGYGFQAQVGFGEAVVVNRRQGPLERFFDNIGDRRDRREGLRASASFGGAPVVVNRR